MEIKEAKELLRDIGLPEKLHNDMCGYVLIALTNTAESSTWEKATNSWMGVHDIIQYLAKFKLKIYAENSRESIRKHCIKPFRDLAILKDNGLATNDKNYKYMITDEILCLIKTYGTSDWETELKYYKRYNTAMVNSYVSEKELSKLPVKINGQDLKFSPGKHNQLQKKILEIFMPKFAGGSECIYVGDTTDRYLYKNEKILSELGLKITLDTLPDVVLYDCQRSWLYFIECVTSVGPINEQRKRDIDRLTKNVNAGNVFVTAFIDMKTCKKFIQELAWETEVWIAEVPDHMIHLNGDRFAGPH